LTDFDPNKSDAMSHVDKAKRRGRVSRANLVPLPFWTSTAARRQLRILAAEEDTTQQKLIAEALNLLFDSRNREQSA
jgi:hypothetical protein